MLQLTEASFDAEVLKSSVPVLVDFWAPWCGPCRVVGPIIEEIAGEMDGKGCKIAKCNVDESGMISQTYGVMGIPTMMVFKDGKSFGQLVGIKTKEEIVALLKSAM